VVKGLSKKTLKKNSNVIYAQTFSEIEDQKPFDVIYCHMAIFELTHQEVEKGNYFFVIALKKGGTDYFSGNQ
jgi:hypothetical protein